MDVSSPSNQQALEQGTSNTQCPSTRIVNNSSPCGTLGLCFVVSTSIEKPDPDLRKLIRSQVMQGKNRGKKHSFRTRKSKRRQGLSNSNYSEPPTSTPCLDENQSWPSATSTTISYPVLPITIPRKFGSDLSAAQFAGEVESGMVEVVLQCELFPTICANYSSDSSNSNPVSSIAKEILWPLETCILFEGKGNTWIAPLAVDSAYLYAMIVSSQYYFDALLSKKPCASKKQTLSYLSKAIGLLRHRLAYGEDQARLSDTTAAAIMSLACHAHMTGDSKSAKQHMEGLCSLISLRGGVATFADNPQLLVQILGYETPPS